VKHLLGNFEPSPANGTWAGYGALPGTPVVRVAMVALALVWTQFPIGVGARAEGGHELALCCAWGKALEDGRLTYSVSAPDSASADVIRLAVREWDTSLPGLELVERPAGSPVDITMAFQVAPGRTEGQAVTSFSQGGLIRRVDVGIEGAPAPANAGGLLQIAKHEFGHALGLGHANHEGNLMSEAVSPHPQTIDACAISGVLEANRWRLTPDGLGLEPAGRPERPRVSDVAC